MKPDKTFYELLEDNLTEYKRIKRTSTVQHIIDFAEQLKRNPDMDLEPLFSNKTPDEHLIKLATEQRKYLMGAKGDERVAAEFLCQECDSIFSVLEEVPVPSLGAYLKVIYKFLTHTKNNTDVWFEIFR